MEVMHHSRSIQPVLSNDEAEKLEISLNSSTDLRKPLSKKDLKLIENLKTEIPAIDKYFDVHQRIGEGTFSNVFLVTLKQDKGVVSSDRPKYAIKHLVPTSHPSRVERELNCLLKIGGESNVIGINSYLRHCDAVAFVMPYLPHDRFHDYFDKLTPGEVQNYMYNLLIALKRVHSFNVIHRDVKPSNFLFNRRLNKYLLVDFGLAQLLTPSALNQPDNQIGVLVPETHKRKHDQIDEADNTSNTISQTNKRIKHNITSTTTTSTELNNENLTTSKVVNRPNESVTDSMIPASPFKTPLKPINEIILPKLPLNFGFVELARLVLGKSQLAGTSPNLMMPSSTRSPNVKPELLVNSSNSCSCFGRNTVCNKCLVKKEIQASRAGTPGYRPPEVLLKYPHQTTSVDIWAAGIIMFSILSGCYPFFRATDDYQAMGEMITVFGDGCFRRLAKQLGRNLTVSIKKEPLHIRKLCLRLRRRYTCKFVTNSVPNNSKMKCFNCDQVPNECLCAISSKNTDFSNDPFPDSAYELLAKLVCVDPKQRITANDALNHAFFKQKLPTSL